MRFLVKKKLNEMHEVTDYKGYEIDVDEDQWHRIKEEGSGEIFVHILKDGKHIKVVNSLKAARDFIDKAFEEDEKRRKQEEEERKKWENKPEYRYFIGFSNDRNGEYDIDGDYYRTEEEAKNEAIKIAKEYDFNYFLIIYDHQYYDDENEEIGDSENIWVKTFDTKTGKQLNQSLLK